MPFTSRPFTSEVRGSTPRVIDIVLLPQGYGNRVMLWACRIAFGQITAVRTGDAVVQLLGRSYERLCAMSRAPKRI